MVPLALLLVVTSVAVPSSRAQLWLRHKGNWYIRVGPIGPQPPNAAQVQQKASSRVAYSVPAPPGQPSVLGAGGGGHYHEHKPAPLLPPAKPAPSAVPASPPQLQPALRVLSGRGPPVKRRPPPRQPNGPVGYPSAPARQSVAAPPQRSPSAVDSWGRMSAWNRQPAPRLPQPQAQRFPSSRNQAGTGRAAGMVELYPSQVPRPNPSPYHTRPQSNAYRGVGTGMMGPQYGRMEPPDIDLRIIPCGESALEITTAPAPGANPVEPRCRCEDPQDCDLPGVGTDPVCPLWTTCCCAPLPPTPAPAATTPPPA